jgi:hypothetical protein
MSEKNHSHDSTIIETGTPPDDYGSSRGDEAELARMGYKQELKCVSIMLSSLTLQ